MAGLAGPYRHSRRMCKEGKDTAMSSAGVISPDRPFIHRDGVRSDEVL
jgi:hypothetical protein